MIKYLSENIAIITKDYHSDDNEGFVMTSQHVLDWAHQFEEQDREFVLKIKNIETNSLKVPFQKSCTPYIC